MLQVVSDDVGLRGAVALGQLGQDPRARSLLAQAQAALEENPRIARLMLDQLSDMLSAAAPQEVARFAPPTVARGGLAAWQLRQVRAHIDANLDRTLHVETLAQLARLSTSHFCRAFKVSTGETAHTFIMRRRLERAQNMMLNSAESLSQIAAACGLADQAHLTRLFRRYTGETPFAWRRAFRTPQPSNAPI